MIAIRAMAMICFPAQLVISEMGIYNGCNRRNQKPDLCIMPYLFAKQKQYSKSKKQIRPGFMVMFFVTMPQGISTNYEGDANHYIFKRLIINDVCSKYR